MEQRKQQIVINITVFHSSSFDTSRVKILDAGKNEGNTDESHSQDHERKSQSGSQLPCQQWSKKLGTILEEPCMMF